MKLYRRRRNEFRFLYLTAMICVYLCPFFFLAHISYAQDFTAETLGDYGNITVMEVTGNYDANKANGTINSEPRQTIAKEFFRLHKDEYDFLVIFSNFNFIMPESEAVAFYSQVKEQKGDRLLFE